MTSKLYATAGNVLLKWEKDEGFSASFISVCALLRAHLLAWPRACLICFSVFVFVFLSHPRLHAACLCFVPHDSETPDITLFIIYTILLSARS